MNFICLNCKKEKKIGKNAKGKYCSLKCQGIFQRKQKVLSGNAISPKPLKRYLTETVGHQCSVCSYKEWNNQPIPLELDHIDGNPLNNKISNVRLICPNCHSQTPTYKVKNKGNGRYFRRQRYQDGKSY